MATAAQIAANRENAQASTGPRTETGKDHSSRNSTTLGLFTLHDFVRPGEHDEYARLCSRLRAELNPAGALEETFAAAIIGATWRLRRCALIEERMAGSMAEIGDLDPMEDEQASRLQSSVDRARSQAHNLLRRSIAELRRLQTEATIRAEIFQRAAVVPDPDLTSHREVTIALNHHDRGKLLARKLDQIDSLAGLMGIGPGAPTEPNGGSLAAPPAQMASFCNQPPIARATPRNAPCPCGSRLKHKRCCGKSAPAILHPAA